ncbi:hypothetical protein [Bifidobacterium callitrichidarum]|uniref:Uncharacterized protein n=1 Tax=Bifidobacterium callitrichidarum TaxID=2052941 RepID=A0A2U2N8P4_9BIFI|nr:hypothetical protein [Bifidobacterium callitrichidarum]PWG65571.1 hypothetical protein DF196_06450 [Bifidobacterium callitrichidarum]
MGAKLEGLYDPKTGDAGLAAFTVRTLRKQGHVTTREEVLEMQQDIGREWTEAEIEHILAANNI